MGALMAFLEEVLQLVVRKNSDLITGYSMVHYGSCRVRSAVFWIRIPCSLVRRRVCARSDFPLRELADWIPWCQVQRHAYACSDCPPGELADWILLCQV